MLKKIFVLFLVLIFIAVTASLAYFAYLYEATKFTAEKIIFYNPPQSALFFDRNGNLLDVRYSKENRIYVKYNEIPPRVIETLFAAVKFDVFEQI